MSKQQQAAEQAFLRQHGGNVPDLGTMATPRPSSPARSSAANPLTGMGSPLPGDAHDAGDLTPTERNLCEAELMRLNARWMRRVYDEDSPENVWDQFANEARNAFGSIGFVIDIMWSEVKGDPNEGLTGTAAIPQITIIGRTDKSAGTDYELIKREVAQGLHDGQKGYIREDGSRHEDPIKKTI